LQCAAVCCSVLQCAAVCCSVLQCAAVYCGVLQCVAVFLPAARTENLSSSVARILRKIEESGSEKLPLPQ